MERHQFLTVVHERYKPRSYLEIGINDGLGLARSTTRTIGVDPDFCISVELACDLKLVKATSDDYFAQADAISWFPEGVVDFTFIDGLHLFEVALRDFMNAERLSAATSVIVLDDVLPRSVSEAARRQHTLLWAGDTYKVTSVLERYRPDLTVVLLDTDPTGMLLVVDLDPSNTVLREHYDEIVAEYATDDPQAVPDEVLFRRGASDPQGAADSLVWAELTRARDIGGPVPPMDDIRSSSGSTESR
jgi:hypothetical protein